MKEKITSGLILLLAFTVIILAFFGKEKEALKELYITIGFLLGASLPGLLESTFKGKKDTQQKN